MRNNPQLPLITGPVIRLVPQVTNDVQVNEYVLDYMAAAPIVLTNVVLLNFLTAWRAACETQLAGTLASDSNIRNYLVMDVSQGTVPTQVVNTGGVPGTDGATSLPGTSAAVQTKGSVVKGQHGRGRMYAGPVPVTFTTPGTNNNELNAHALTQYNALHAALLVTLAVAGTNWNFAISTRPIPPNTLIIRGTQVTSLLAQLQLGTIRRRREGRGI